MRTKYNLRSHEQRQGDQLPPICYHKRGGFNAAGEKVDEHTCRKCGDVLLGPRR